MKISEIPYRNVKAMFHPQNAKKYFRHVYTKDCNTRLAKTDKKKKDIYLVRYSANIKFKISILASNSFSYK